MIAKSVLVQLKACASGREPPLAPPLLRHWTRGRNIVIVQWN